MEFSEAKNKWGVVPPWAEYLVDLEYLWGAEKDIDS
jgi:hypothetical protein